MVVDWVGESVDCSVSWMAAPMGVKTVEQMDDWMVVWLEYHSVDKKAQYLVDLKAGHWVCSRVDQWDDWKAACSVASKDK